MTLTEEDNSSIYFSCDEEEEGVSNSEYSDDGNTFKIVLVNIKETFDQLHVHCEEFEFLESGPEVEYITLSYRWGELNEQRVAATEDYNAHITSFLLKDFYRLCLRMMTEPDLENINYVWVDAICVDQANEQHKKATIYRMSDIYEHATYIVAVPDLHKESLLDTSKTHRVMSKKIIKYRWYLYHFISENYQELDQLLNTLEIPSDYNLQRFIGKDPSIWDVGDSEDEEEEEEEIKWEASLTEKKLQNKDMQNCLAKYQRHIRKRFMEKKIKGILASLYHIRDMFLDWANRAWVISEYHIAKRRKDGQLKYWFIHLDGDNDFHFNGNPFFTFDFNDDQEKTEPDGFEGPSGQFITVMYDLYHLYINYVLVNRDFIDMILNSKASKHEDRFHAMLPVSSKYNKIKRTKDTIFHWHISDIQSVILKLYEILDPEDMMCLLYSCVNTPNDVLPTFTLNNWIQISYYFSYKAQQFTDSEYNFDISDSSSSILFEPSNRVNTQYKGPRLHLRPKTYDVYTSIDFSWQETAEFKRYTRLFKRLGIDMDDSFTLIKIQPIFSQDEDDQPDFWDVGAAVRLLGTMEKNVWIFCNLYYCADRLTSQRYVNDDNIVFTVY